MLNICNCIEFQNMVYSFCSCTAGPVLPLIALAAIPVLTIIAGSLLCAVLARRNRYIDQNAIEPHVKCSYAQTCVQSVYSLMCIS